MKAVKYWTLAPFLVVALLWNSISFSQERVGLQLPDLIGSWTLMVEGDSKVRVLKIKSVLQQSGESASLDAVFGLAGERENPVSPQFGTGLDGPRLTFSSKSGADVNALRQSDGSFSGTYTINGKTKNLKMTKVGADDLAVLATYAKESRAAALLVSPNADVPQSCAFFGGRWSGVWSQGGVGTMWLWVVEMNADCMAKIAYLDSDKTPTRFERVQIFDGALQWMCNKSTMGTCVLKRQGNDLSASYSNPAGGANSALFKKLP